jgi:3-oxoacyl-(acyl-carrier-protein) synthase
LVVKEPALSGTASGFAVCAAALSAAKKRDLKEFSSIKQMFFENFFSSVNTAHQSKSLQLFSPRLTCSTACAAGGGE